MDWVDKKREEDKGMRKGGQEEGFVLRGRTKKSFTMSHEQFGFRKGKSCVTNLLSYYDRVAETMQEEDIK